MGVTLDDKASGLALGAGAILLLVYVVATAVVLPPLGNGVDFATWVVHPYWRALVLLAFAGVILLLFGIMGVYARIRATAGIIGLLGFVATELTLLFTACTVSLELLVYPSIGKAPGALFLLRDLVILNDPVMQLFRLGMLAVTMVGLIFFNLALFRSRAFGTAPPLMMVAGALLSAMGPMSVAVERLGIGLFALGCMVLAASLVRGGAEQAVP